MDDLANKWGRYLCLCSGKRDYNSSEKEEEFKRAVKRLCTPFHVADIMGSGPSANSTSCIEATGGRTDKLLVGCGSYVSGSGNLLDSWSTSQFDSRHSFAEINTDKDTIPEVALKHTVPLPYHIPCDRCCNHENMLTKLEDKCLQEIHARCLREVAMTREPVKALLLELILAGCGAELSDRFLGALGELAEKHDFWIIVDEILTGGRTGRMLLTTLKPDKFQHRVSHITLGKWIGVGISLVNPSFKTSNRTLNMTARGETTRVNVAGALSMWEEVCKLLDSTSERRKQVLKHMKCSEDLCWGAGVLIYGPRRRHDSKKALKCRLTPLLTPTPID